MKIRNRLLLFILTAAAVLHPVINYSCRVGYVAVDERTFTGLSYMLLVVMLLNLLLWVCLYFNREKQKLPNRTFLILFISGSVIQAASAGFHIAYFILGEGYLDIFFLYFKRLLPYLLTFFISMFMLFVLPKLKPSPKKAVTVFLAVTITLTVCVTGFRIYPFKFDSGPVAFITQDSGVYSIVWATSQNATGAVEYTYNGEEYIVYEKSAGIIRSNSRIHRVTVPREHLEGNSYRVVSARVYERLGNSAIVMKPLYSEHFSFKKYENGEDVVALSFSDWHDLTGLAVRTADHVREPDILYVVGDAMTMTNTIDSVIDYLLAACAGITKSICPVVYVRGNHEPRGEYAIELMNCIGLSSFYYTYSWGPVSGIVLDCGEDKPDDHIQFAGLVAFEPYMQEQTEWLQNLEYKNTAGYNISLCHTPRINDVWKTQLTKYETDLLLTGHSHRVDLRLPKEGALNNFPIYIDGGKINLFAYSASEIILSGNTAEIRAVKNDGTVVFSDSYDIIVN